MNKAIDQDIYNLDDWTAVNSSQSALMAQLEKSIEDKDWICFMAWKPNRMNTQYDIKYLED